MKVAIVGLGLIGGSIALALKKSTRGSELTIIGIPRREETLKEALEKTIIDEGTIDLKKGVSDADVVFICTPISLVTQIIDEIGHSLKPGAIVTDVASSKESIVAKAESLLPPDVFFVGGHPMAGREKVKLAAAESGLFKDRIYILTPTKKSDRHAVKALTDLITLLGAKILKLDPVEHDRVVAAISHMPLAISAALVNTIAEHKHHQKEMVTCASTGFRDTTRIASGDPALGIDMFLTNNEAVLEMIDEFKSALTRLEAAIREHDTDAIAKLLKQAQNFRDDIYR